MSTMTYEIATAVEPIKGTLLHAADVQEGMVRGVDPGSAVGQYPSYNCLAFAESPAFCAPNEKDLDQVAGWQDALIFGAYGGATCKTIGMRSVTLDDSELKQGVDKAFRLGEYRAVEMALMAQRFRANAAGSGLPGEWAVPPDVNSGGAVHPRVAVALLEEDASKKYAGRPTLHLSRAVASLLTEQGALEWDGETLRTKLGSKVAAGGGYDVANTSPTGTAHAAGERWLYATGEVQVRKGELNLRQAIDTGNNDVYVLAERSYMVTVDCYTAAVRSTVAA